MEATVSILDANTEGATLNSKRNRRANLARHIVLWLRSVVNDFEACDVTFDPLIDFPRDI